MDSGKAVNFSNAYKTATCLLVFMVTLNVHPQAMAKDWLFTPSFKFSETFSDNINLAPKGNEKSAFVTEFSPAISIRNFSARNRLNLDYRMQNLYNAGGNKTVDTFHNLQFNSNSELRRNSLFLDLNSTISQQNVSNTLRTTGDNLSGSGGRTNVYTYGVSPYWRPHLGGYVDGEVRFRYDGVNTDNSFASDTETYTGTVNLFSGRRSSRLTWALDYSNQVEKREAANGAQFQEDNIQFEEGLAELRGHFSRYFNVFTQIGFSDNSFESVTDDNNDGFFYTFGAEWKPNQRFGIEVGVGNNSFVTVALKPTRHMNWITTYRNRDVGLNTGNTWETRFDFLTKRSIWRASYVEDTTTTSSELRDVQGFTTVDEFGNEINDPAGQQQGQSDISLPTLIDQVFVRKRGEFSVAYRTGKSTITARVFNERRIFQASDSNEEVTGIDASWDWRFVRRTSFFIRPLWQQTSTVLNSDDNRFDIALGLTRFIPVAIGRKTLLNARIEYRYINQSSDQDFNDFQENRISASLLLAF